MFLFPASEYAVITLDRAGNMRGAVMQRSRRYLEVKKVAEIPDGQELSERISAMIKMLDVSRSHILIISSALDGGFFFRCTTPDLTARELSSSLVFDAQEQVLQLPQDFRLQFTTRALGDDELSVNVYGFPAGALVNWCNAFGKRRRRVDEFIYPLLVLPTQAEDDKILLPELDQDFYWQNNSWRPVGGSHTEYNVKLLEILKNEVVFSDKCGDDKEKLYRQYITLLMLGRFIENPGSRKQRAGLGVLPPFMRPQRQRNQIRITVFLSLIVLGMLAFSGFRKMAAFRDEYSRITSQVGSANKKATDLRTALKKKDKEYKEMVRINELNIGDHEMLINLARLSEALPAQALVTGLRWSENSVDLTIQTAQQNLDMNTALRRVPMFKVTTFQNRQMNDTIQLITLKLGRVTPGGSSGK